MYEHPIRLVNTKREDIVFIAFQFWLLGISTVAVCLHYLLLKSCLIVAYKLLNESIPHM
jgi:hypothetical protein